MHPWVIVGYLIFNLIITMCTLNPYIIGISFVNSLIVGVYYDGKHFLKMNLLVLVPVAIFTIGIQPLFSHAGTTALFYINNGAVYKESYIYGIAMFFMLAAVIQWFTVFHILIDSEKMLYLFGRLAPTLGMIFSMILRFIPLLRERSRQIHEAQIGMGRTPSNGLLKSIRYRLKELSILVTWSLENSMETSQSMEARGYGLKGRTSYHRFRFRECDAMAIVSLIAGFLYAGWMIVRGKLNMYYLPAIYIDKPGWQQVSTMIVVAALGLYSIAIEIIGHIKNGKEKG